MGVGLVSILRLSDASALGHSRSTVGISTVLCGKL